MTTWLSDEWFEQARPLASGLPARPGCTGRIAEITGGPDGDVSCYWVFEEGGRPRRRRASSTAPTSP